MPFQKGQSGNPKGRPRSSEIDDLRAAIKTVEEKKRKAFLVNCVEMGYRNPAMAVAILKKFIPDKKELQLDATVSQTTIVTPEQEALARQLVDMWVKSKQPKTPEPEKDAPTS